MAGFPTESGRRLDHSLHHSFNLRVEQILQVPKPWAEAPKGPEEEGGRAREEECTGNCGGCGPEGNVVPTHRQNNDIFSLAAAHVISDELVVRQEPRPISCSAFNTLSDCALFDRTIECHHFSRAPITVLRKFVHPVGNVLHGPRWVQHSFVSIQCTSDKAVAYIQLLFFHLEPFVKPVFVVQAAVTSKPNGEICGGGEF